MDKQKKRAIVICIMAAMTALLTGCGKQEEKNDDNTIVKVQVDSIINKDADSENEKEQEKMVVEGAVKFDCMDEIKNASPDSGLIQIDDMIIQYGSKFSDIANEIEKSECTYETEEYNLSSVVPVGETLGIRFYKNGEQYFIIRLINRESKTIELKDCTLYSISVLNDAMDSSYYAGFSDNEINYGFIIDLMKDYEPKKEVFGSDAKGNKELGVMYTIPFKEDELYIYFILDGVTNKLITFDLSSKELDTVAWPW